MSEVTALADVTYNPVDIGASIASGSFETMGMVVIPCSIKTLSGIANSFAGDLITRAADVTMKEGRPLVLVVREAPRSGAVIFPPMPAFYARPASLDEMVDNIGGRVLARVGVENETFEVWEGLNKSKDS